MKIIYKKITDLKEYSGNAKIHTDEQIEQIMKSIQNVGFLDPIGIDEDGMIIEGHGRYYAAQKLNMEEVPCIELIGLTETQKKAYILAHNKLTMNTGYDFDKLSNELKSLKEDSFEEFHMLGFEDHEVEELTNTIDYESLLEELYTAPAGNFKKSKTKHRVCPSCGHEWDE